MNTPLKYPSVRLTVPVPVEAHEAFRELAAVTGRSVGSLMGEWLMDTSDSVREMARQLRELQGSTKAFAREVHALTNTVNDATAEVLARAQKGPAGAVGRTRSGRPAAAGGPLTPPSSNTGGKVAKRLPKSSKGRS